MLDTDTIGGSGWYHCIFFHSFTQRTSNRFEIPNDPADFILAFSPPVINVLPLKYNAQNGN